jgi:hypothetical protein
MIRRYPFRLCRVLCALAALFAVAGAVLPAWAQFETRATTPGFPKARIALPSATLTTTESSTWS